VKKNLNTDNTNLVFTDLTCRKCYFKKSISTGLS